MAEVKDLITVGIGFCDVEVASDQGYQKRIEDVIQEFVKYLETFVGVSLA